MKRWIVLFIAITFSTIIYAQKYAYVDTDYILSNIPAFKAAQDKLNSLSANWQKEIEQEYEQVNKLYQEFQTEKVLLTNELIKQKESEIALKEKAVKDLQFKYFGPQGQLYQKRMELIRPIQDEVYNVIKDIAESGNYAIIFDTAAGATILFTDPKYDKSDEVLEKLGYKN